MVYDLSNIGTPSPVSRTSFTPPPGSNKRSFPSPPAYRNPAFLAQQQQHRSTPQPNQLVQQSQQQQLNQSQQSQQQQQVQQAPVVAQTPEKRPTTFSLQPSQPAQLPPKIPLASTSRALQATRLADIPLDQTALRASQAKAAFRTLRWNILYLFTLWWIGTSRPYRYVRKAYADPNAEAIAYYLGRALVLLFLFNICYGLRQLFFPSTKPPNVALASSQMKTTPATRDSISPLSRSSPKTRPSTPSRTATPVHRQASPSRQSPFSQSPSLRSQLLAASPAGKRDYLSEQQAKERQLRERAFEARHMETSPGKTR